MREMRVWLNNQKSLYDAEEHSTIHNRNFYSIPPKINIKYKENENKIGYLNIYSRRLELIIRKKKDFYYGRLANSTKILAFAKTKLGVINLMNERLSMLFEKSAISNNFLNWNKLTGDSVMENQDGLAKNDRINLDRTCFSEV